MTTNTPEFSRPIAVEGIMPDKTRPETVEATAEECAALAVRFDLRSLSNLKAKMNIRRVLGGASIKLDGEFDADLVQACVVTLRDVPSHIHGTFETFFTEHRPKNDDDEIELDLDNDEVAPEIIDNGVLDLGEAVAQYLALEINLYPRAPGVSLAAQLAESGAEVKNNPFQVLEGLAGGKGKTDK